MRATESDLLALRTLAAMPFLDYLELAAVSGMAESTARHVLGRLRRKGLANHLRHASPLTAATRRWFATNEGLRSLASENGTALDRLLRMHPVSAHWRRILLARLDAVAVVYRLASAVADAIGPSSFRWYRAAPLDAGMTLPDGRTVGVIRQGPTADRTSISDRVRRLLDPEQSRPRALLALMPDGARLRQARRLLASYPGPVYLALEKDVSGMLAYFYPVIDNGAPPPLPISCPFARSLLTSGRAARCPGRRQHRDSHCRTTPTSAGLTTVSRTTCSPPCSSPPGSGCWIASPTGP